MKFKKISITVASALLVLSGGATAAGFALIEQSGSGLGNAYAGGAASAEDASTIYYNPAGMSRLAGKQMALAGNMIKPSAKFSGTVTGLAPFETGGTDTGGDAGSWALVPNAYFAMELNPQTHIGLGINAPFGLVTEYNTNWIGRFEAIKSKLETINLNPSVSYQFNDTVSLGIGLNYQHVKGELSSSVNYPAAVYGATLAGALAKSVPLATAQTAAMTAATPFANQEGISTLTGSDNAWGYNLGALFNVSPQTRLGIAYRSSIKYNLSGSVNFSNIPSGLAPSFPTQPVTLAIKLPDSFSASAFHQLNDKWEVMADASWTGWSVFKQLDVLKANGSALSSTPENWKDTWRISTGATYHYNSQWLSRIGIAYDQTPTSDTYRTPRIPDGDRTWLSIGGQYKPAKDSALDFGYAHLFVSSSTLSQNATANPDLAGKGYLTGSYKNSVDILSMQYSHSF